MTNLPIGDFPNMPLQGWQCPVCKSVMSPMMMTCFRCTSQYQQNTNSEMTRCIVESIGGGGSGLSQAEGSDNTLSTCIHGVPVKFKLCPECKEYSMTRGNLENK